MRRSLVAVLSGIAAFAASQLVLAVVLEIGLPEVRDPLYGRRVHFVQNSLHHETAKPWTVVMLGTSRTLLGFRPGPAQKTWGKPAGRPIASFNFGILGASSLTELLIWRRLRQDGVRPDLVLIEVMPPLLCSQTPFGDFSPTHWPTARLRWHDLALVKRYAGATRPNLRRDWLINWMLPCYSQRCSLISLVAPDLDPRPNVFKEGNGWNADEFGGQNSPTAPTPDERRRCTQYSREGYSGFLNGFRLGGPGCEALRELTASCRKEGVPMALVLMPEGPAFRSWYSRETLHDVQEWITQLGRENGAPVIDAREWMAEDDFKDSNHLLSDAAVRFTDRLGREYIRPLLQKLSDEERSPRRLAVVPSQS